MSGTAPEPDRHEDLVARFLAGNDIVCPVCNYSLTDLPGGNCPECGLELELRISLSKPRQKIYILGLIGLGAGIGFNGLLLVYFLWYFVTGGSLYGPGLADLISLSIGLVIEIPAIIVWSRSWSFFQRRSKPVGVTLVLLCWAITIITAVWFFVEVG